MQRAPVTIDRRFRGPLASANGGYTAGLLARLLDAGPGVEVTLRLPPPLDRPRRDGDRRLLPALDRALLERYCARGVSATSMPPSSS